MTQRPNRRQYPLPIDSTNATTPLLGSPSVSKSTPVSNMIGNSSSSQVYQTFQSGSGGSHLPTTLPVSTTAQQQGLIVTRPKPKQPNRTTKTSQKLKLFPEEEDQTVYMPDDLTADVYTQLAQIPHGTARVEAERLSKMNRDDLPRVTAYCTAS